MPQRVSRWNYTDRGSHSSHNDTYRGQGNPTYIAPTQRQNQGFASVIATFPQGSFATCRYPVSPEQQRTAEQNTWHPQSVPSTQSPAPTAAAAAAASGPSHNTTGTKPLPIPFSQRPGYAEEEAAKAAAAEAAYQAFRTRHATAAAAYRPPTDEHEHTQYAPVHVATELQPGEIFRQSRPRIGTTPLERAHAAQRAAEEVERIEREAQARERAEKQREARNRRAIEAGGDFRTAEGAAVQEGPEHYNLPPRTQHPHL